MLTKLHEEKIDIFDYLRKKMHVKHNLNLYCVSKMWLELSSYRPTSEIFSLQYIKVININVSS